jgi:hypothetical protein
MMSLKLEPLHTWSQDMLNYPAKERTLNYIKQRQEIPWAHANMDT